MVCTEKCTFYLTEKTEIGCYVQDRCAHNIIFSHFLMVLQLSSFSNSRAVQFLQRDWDEEVPISIYPFCLRASTWALSDIQSHSASWDPQSPRSEVSRRDVFSDSSICLDLSNGNLRDHPLVLKRTLLRPNTAHLQSTYWPYRHLWRAASSFQPWLQLTASKQGRDPDGKEL